MKVLERIKTNYKKIENTEKQGIELYFDTIPTAKEREILKENGFRWSNYSKCWYIKKGNIEKPIEKKAKTKNNTIDSELMEQYKKDVAIIWHDPKMQDYEIKKVNYIVPLENNDYFVIEKPSIQTRFCFGYHDIMPRKLI